MLFNELILAILFDSSIVILEFNDVICDVLLVIFVLLVVNLLLNDVICYILLRFS